MKISKDPWDVQKIDLQRKQKDKHNIHIYNTHKQKKILPQFVPRKKIPLELKHTIFLHQHQRGLVVFNQRRHAVGHLAWL